MATTTYTPPFPDWDPGRDPDEHIIGAPGPGGSRYRQLHAGELWYFRHDFVVVADPLGISLVQTPFTGETNPGIPVLANEAALAASVINPYDGQIVIVRDRGDGTSVWYAYDSIENDWRELPFPSAPPVAAPPQTYPDIATRDANAGTLVSGQIARVLDDGSGNPAVYVYDAGGATFFPLASSGGGRAPGIHGTIAIRDAAVGVYQNGQIAIVNDDGTGQAASYVFDDAGVTTNDKFKRIPQKVETDLTPLVFATIALRNADTANHNNGQIIKVTDADGSGNAAAYAFNKGTSTYVDLPGSGGAGASPPVNFATVALRDAAIGTLADGTMVTTDDTSTTWFVDSTQVGAAQFVEIKTAASGHGDPQTFATIAARDAAQAGILPGTPVTVNDDGTGQERAYWRTTTGWQAIPKGESGEAWDWDKVITTPGDFVLDPNDPDFTTNGRAEGLIRILVDLDAAAGNITAQVADGFPHPTHFQIYRPSASGTLVAQVETGTNAGTAVRFNGALALIDLDSPGRYELTSTAPNTYTGQAFSSSAGGGSGTYQVVSTGVPKGGI